MDERLPPYSRWMDKAEAYTRNWSVFRCPAVPDPEGFGYCLNNESSRLTSIRHRESYPLVFDTSDLSRDAFGRYAAKLASPARHPGGCNWVGYADGHAKQVCEKR